MTEYITIEEAAKLLDQNEGTIRRKCIFGRFIGAKKENGSWRIPITCHEKFRLPKRLIGADDLSHLPIHKRDSAIKKLGIINQCEEFTAQFVRTNGSRRNAIQVFAAKNEIGFRTLYRWLESHRKYGLLGLVDTRGTSDVSEPMFSPEAAEEFKRMFLTPRKLSLKQCYQNIKSINNQFKKGWQIPGLRSIYNWVEKYIPEPVIILHRDGQKAYEAACAPYIQKDFDSISPGEVWVSDHYQFNFWIRYKNTWTRPWLTSWMDMRSRCIVGWYISPSPNQTTILIAMRGGIEKYGPPDSVKIDNGKDYDSQMWTGVTKSQRRKGMCDEFLVAGIYGMMNISVSFAIPYNAKAKSIERFHYTIDEQFNKTITTYCGNKPENKPENLEELLQKQSVIDSAYNFDSLTEIFGRWLEAYNNSAHSGEGMDGRSPNQVMNMRVSKRVISSDILDMLMCCWVSNLKIGKNGVRVKGLLYGQFEPRLINHFGEEVKVAYNPHDLRQVTVYLADGLQRLCIAEQNQLVKYGKAVDEESLREAMRKKSAVARAHRNWIEKRGDQYMDLTDLTIKALNESAVKTEAAENPKPALRPVRTVLDTHLDEHLQEQKQKILRKAAGAENTKVIDIDLYSLTKPKEEKRSLRLFEK